MTARLDVGRSLVRRLPSALRREVEARLDLGVRRYGERLTTGNGRCMVRDLREELLDGLLYCEGARLEGVIGWLAALVVHGALRLALWVLPAMPPPPPPVRVTLRYGSRNAAEALAAEMRLFGDAVRVVERGGWFVVVPVDAEVPRG